MKKNTIDFYTTKKEDKKIIIDKIHEENLINENFYKMLLDSIKKDKIFKKYMIDFYNDILQILNDNDIKENYKKRKANKFKKYLIDYILFNENINEENLYTTTQKITIKALNTIYAKSSDKTILNLCNNLIIDLKQNINLSNQNLTNAYDLYQNVLMYIWIAYKHAKTNNDYFTLSYIDYYNNDIENFNNEGKNITLKDYIYKKINSYIYTQKKQLKKEFYIEDINVDNLYYTIDNQYNIDNFYDLIVIKTLLKNINLTDRQNQILKYRFKGFSYRDIMKKINLKDIKSITNHIKAIQNNIAKININILNEDIEKQKKYFDIDIQLNEDLKQFIIYKLKCIKYLLLFTCKKINIENFNDIENLIDFIEDKKIKNDLLYLYNNYDKLNEDFLINKLVKQLQKQLKKDIENINK